MPGLVADLGKKSGAAHLAVDAKARHGAVECGNKKARDLAGVGKELQQLLLGQGPHLFSPDEKKPARWRASK